MSPRPSRISTDDGHLVTITQALEDRVQSLEEQFHELGNELRRRFGDESFAVERSEQVLGAIQRLRWAISLNPIVNPLSAASEDTSPPDEDL